MTTGHARTLIIHMSGPMEMQAMKIDLKQLNLFTGTNGVGKSLVLKISWVLQMIAQLVIGKQELKEGAQFIIDNSIPDHDMMAILIMEFETGATVSVRLHEGKVARVDYEGFEKIDQLQKCTFMSSQMRTFNDIKHYLFVRKTVTDPKDPLKITEMVKHFKLYDVMYIEGLISRMPLVLDESTKKTLKAFDIEGLESIEFSGDDFIGTFEGKKQNLSNLGSGHQSLINMTIGAL